MSATQDESQDLDAGWDDTDEGVTESSAEPEPSAEEVDGGWDDAEVAPAGSGTEPSAGGGRRRPHRQRRAKSQAVPLSSNPVLLPRPAEPSKKQQREHARQQRAHEAQVKQQRKAERKAERAEQARQEAAERVRQAEAEERARKMRQEARERARSDRPAPTPSAKPSRARPRAAELKRDRATPVSQAPKRGPRYGVIVTLLALAAAVALLVLRK